MAEESVNMSLSPEFTKPGEDNMRRKSIGTPLLFSNEAGKKENLSNGEKPVPHYLRASTGSCHDLCKYGRKHAPEAKGRSSIRKMIMASRPPDAKKPVEKIIQEEKKKATNTKLKPSPCAKAGLPQNPKIIRLEVSSPSEIVKVSPKHASENARGMSDLASTKKKVDASSAQAPPNARGRTHAAKHMTPLKLKPMTVKSLPSPDHLKGSSGTRNSDINLGQKAGASKVALKPLPSPDPFKGSSGRRNSEINSGQKIGASKGSGGRRNSEINSGPKIGASKGSGGRRNSEINLGQKIGASKGSGGRRNSEINLGQKIGASKVVLKKVLASSVARSSPEPFVEVASMEARKSRISVVVSPLKNQNRIRKADPQNPKDDQIPEKTFRTTLFSKPSINPVASLNAKKYKSIKVVSPLKNLNRTRKAESHPPDDDKVVEKTLYVVNTDTVKETLGSSTDESPTAKLSPSPFPLSAESSSQPTSPSLPSQEEEEEEDQEESEYTISDADDFMPEDDGTECLNESENSKEEDNETKNMNEAEDSEREYKRRPRKKAGVVHCEDKDSLAVKLNFRRGKVLDLHSETKGPRKLRFRQGRQLGENQNGNDGGRRSYKRRGVDDDTNGAKDESEKVVLRHQDVQGKKDAQGLLNNVIEETASKLVETRKSKVKALVGAFETVISLQETKPSTNTVV